MLLFLQATMNDAAADYNIVANAISTITSAAVSTAVFTTTAAVRTAGANFRIAAAPFLSTAAATKNAAVSATRAIPTNTAVFIVSFLGGTAVFCALFLFAFLRLL